ncbi:MAG: hypothetical protein HQ521_22005 [Bacteroidetes bacterium]|nr:hypothetical protein [Bacteroidota bacterium]
MTKKGIIQIGVIAAIIIVVATWYLIEQVGRVDGEPLDMIPTNAALVMEIDNPSITYAKLNNNNSIWQKALQLADVSSLRDNLISFDTLLVDNPGYYNLLWNSALTIAVYYDSISGVESLILSQIESNPNIVGLKKMLGTKLGRDYGVLDIAGISDGFKIVDAERNQTSYFAIVDGVFVYSSSLKLLSRLIDTYKGTFGNLKEDVSFVKLQQTSSSKAQARVFIQYEELSKLFSPYIVADELVALNWLGNFASWTEIDMLLKNNELIFSGFTIADSHEKHLASFQDQQAVKIEAINILPYNTNTLIWIGIPDFISYFNNRTTGLNAKTISSEIKFDVDKLLTVLGNEVVFASNAESIGGFANGSWFAVKISDVKEAKSDFGSIARIHGNAQTSKYEGYTIGKINKTDFIPLIFGDAFSTIKQNYYTFVGDYVVFANSENSIINLIRYIETGKTLDLNDNFKNFSDNISTKSNLLVYLKPGELAKRFGQIFNQTVSRELELNKKVVSSFQGLSFQLTSGNQLCFTNIYTNHSGVHHEENLALWKVQLDDEIVWEPTIVSDHQSRKQNIIVFDKQDNMYLIDPDGRILWKKKLDATPVGEIFEVDYYKNEKIQYLFNTGNYIYLIDKNGNSVKGYPKKLHSKATNGIVVFDYLGNKDYRLVVAQADKKVYNYSIEGDEIRGWSKPRTSNIVIDPVTRLLANKKDYIIITDIENEIKIVNRKGNRRINISGNLKKAKNSDYYVNRTNSKGIIITTDQQGNLVYISSSGKLNNTDFGKFSPEHFFLYEDFNGDGSIDFIYIDDNKLTVFDRFKKVLFSYNFGSNISIKPSFFSLGNKYHVLGVVADKEKTIYLFDSKGNIIISKGLVGETPFTVGNLEGNNKINLVSAAGSTLYNYRLR